MFIGSKECSNTILCSGLKNWDYIDPPPEKNHLSTKSLNGEALEWVVNFPKWLQERILTHVDDPQTFWENVQLINWSKSNSVWKAEVPLHLELMKQRIPQKDRHTYGQALSWQCDIVEMLSYLTLGRLAIREGNMNSGLYQRILKVISLWIEAQA